MENTFLIVAECGELWFHIYEPLLATWNQVGPSGASKLNIF